MAARFIIPTIADAERIARVHVASWHEAYGGIVPAEVLSRVDEADRIERWREYLAVPGHPTFLAEVEGEAAGFIRSGPVAQPFVPGADGHIFALYVLRRHHRLGIGRRLLGLAARAWRGQGARALSVGVLTANQPARAFYEAAGACFARPDVFEWHGHSLPESLYLFENLEKLSQFA